MPATVKQQIVRIFTKKYNLTVRADAVKYLETVCHEHDLHPSQIGEALEHVVTEYIKQDDYATIVETDALKQILEQLKTADSLDDEQIGDADIDIDRYFSVVNAFDMPRVVFDPDRKNFDTDNAGSIIADADGKAAMYRDRYQILKQVILRNDNFSPPPFAGKDRSKYMKLTAVKNLLGRYGESFLLFGMLTQMGDGRYYLEDPDAHVQLDLSETIPSQGLFTDNCFVLADGTFTQDNIFKVYTLGHPPAEPRTVTKSVFGHFDFIGGHRITSIKDEGILTTLERQFQKIFYVILSEVHLDKPKTMANLKRMFEGYAQADLTPFLFILTGNFMSEPFHLDGTMSQKYKDSFKNLADLIASFPVIAKTSHFVFVPGPNDPWGSTVIPRPPLPDYFVARLKAKIPNAVFTTNPCRIKYFTQEIVIYRENLVSKMRRNCVLIKRPELEELDPANPLYSQALEIQRQQESADVKKHLVRTIIDQAHLCPLPISVQPRYWSFDHALRLYPLPTCVIVADNYDQYELTYEGCHVLNPGSFHANACWSVYYPADRASERSGL